jgi:hypothetical protein
MFLSLCKDNGNTFKEDLMLRISTTATSSHTRASDFVLKGNGNYMDEQDIRKFYKDWGVTRWVIAE